VLREALMQVLGDKRFGESKCRLVIPTYDAIARAARAEAR